MTSNFSFASLLLPFQQSFEKKISTCVAEMGPKTNLRDACEYALVNGGKRFRPALVLMIAKALGNQIDASQAAMAIELFHTASLIADDLPCMDDDDQRRQKPSTHKVFGEATALLATYALIAEGYRCIAKNCEAIKKRGSAFSAHAGEIALLAIENATFQTGIQGATGGQFLDIYPPDLSLSTMKQIIHQKTVSLFEISFVFGWLFGGGDVNRLDVVKKSAAHFGLAFQIADDLDDMEQDIANKKFVNLANAFGKDKAIELFYEEIKLFEETLDVLKLHSEELNALKSFLIETAKQSLAAKKVRP